MAQYIETEDLLASVLDENADMDDRRYNLFKYYVRVHGIRYHVTTPHLREFCEQHATV